MIVLDASVLVEVLLSRQPVAGSAREHLLDHADGIEAPHLVDAEAGSALRGLVARGELSPSRARQALDDLADRPINRYPHTPLLPRAFALRDNLTVYDALYVALAELLDVELLTVDARIAGTAGHRARVTVLGP